MAETAKVSGPEEASSNTEEPGIGAKKLTEHLAEASSKLIEDSSAELKASQELEGSNDPQPENLEEKNTDTFAGDVAERRTEAVEIHENDDLDEGEHASDEGEDSSDYENEEGFFTGWDGFDEIHELSSAEELVDDEEQTQPFEGEAGHRTLSEIALASGTLHTLEGSNDSGAGLSSKHDELADAVQSALMSVYGEEPSDAADRRSVPPPPDMHASGPGWASEDSLSPQDVILNYFDYQPAPGNGRGTISDYANAGYNSDTPGVFTQPHDYPPPQYRPQWASSPPALAEYDDPEPYPTGHGKAPKSADTSERESSRLLGAAAIGLVGGIAIAASLAVFVINSYGPGGRAAPGASAQTADPSPAGYGRWGKNGADLEASKAAEVASVPDAAPVLAASDVLVMSGQPSPLAIKVKPEQANEKALISITGIPEGARLNAGVDAGGGNWLLPPRRLDGLTINVPAGAPDAALLGVQVLDSNIRTPLSEKKQFSIRVSAAKAEPAAQTTVVPRTQPEIVTIKPPQPDLASVPETPKPARAAATFFSTETVPASASVMAPQAEPQAKPANANGAGPQTALRQAALQAPAASSDQQKVAPKTEIEELIREGNKRMRDGDILEARQLYQKAVALGDPEAALAMGRSYDPIYFAR
ncbi:MAG TPA: hypothetical protein VNR65_08435, partial [Geobacterales bacterium]|nr:hypothetical protein [Geobacterales bacterium]